MKNVFIKYAISLCTLGLILISCNSPTEIPKEGNKAPIIELVLRD